MHLPKELALDVRKAEDLEPAFEAAIRQRAERVTRRAREVESP